MEPPDGQAAAANTDMAHILEHLCSEDGLSNMVRFCAEGLSPCAAATPGSLEHLHHCSFDVHTCDCEWLDSRLCVLCQALPASLFGDFSLAAGGLHASPLRGMQSPLGAFRSPPGRSRLGRLTAPGGSPAPSFGGSLLGRFGAAATELPSKLPMTAFGGAGDGFSQLEMDVGSLLGLGAGGPAAWLSAAALIRAAGRDALWNPRHQQTSYAFPHRPLHT